MSRCAVSRAAPVSLVSRKAKELHSERPCESQASSNDFKPTESPHRWKATARSTRSSSEDWRPGVKKRVERNSTPGAA